MPPIFTPSAYLMFRLRRVCRQCGLEQVIPEEYRDQSVPCKACGAELPPPPPEKP